MSTTTSANQIWHTLQVTHEGINKVKESKISILVHRFELFKMKENETISEMVTRFTDITNSLASLGKEYTQIRSWSASLTDSRIFNFQMGLNFENGFDVTC